MATPLGSTDWGRGRVGTIERMKKLLFLAALAAIAAVVYRVLTTEIPLEES